MLVTSDKIQGGMNMIELTIHINYNKNNPDGYQFDVVVWRASQDLKRQYPCLDGPVTGRCSSLAGAIEDLKGRLNYVSDQPFKFAVAGFHTHGEPCATVKRHIESTLEEYEEQ